MGPGLESTQDLDPLPLASNDYPAVLPHEMYALEPGDIPSRILSWKTRYGFALSLGYQFQN